MAHKNPWKVRKDSKSNSWIIDFSYRDEHGVLRRYRRSAGKGVSKREADCKARGLYRAMQQDRHAFVGEYVDGRRPTSAYPFKDVAGRYYEDKVCLEFKESTQRTHEQILRVHLVPYFGSIDLRSIDTASVVRYRAEKLREGKSRKSVNNHVSVLSCIFRYAMKLRWCMANPARVEDPLKVPNRGTDWLDRDADAAFRAAIQTRDPHYYPFFLAALRTGMRQGELFALRWSSVDLEARQITVREADYRGTVSSTKGNRVRSVAMTPELVAALRPLRGLPGALVFTRPNGRPLTCNVVKHPHNRARMAIGRPGLRFHDLRHSYASQLVAAGVHLQAVKALLGHTEIKTTERYAHLGDQVLTEAVGRLDDWLKADRPQLRRVQP
jgi:integrase